MTPRRRRRRWHLLSIREPIPVPRWMLTVKYLGFIALGITAMIAGIPTLNLTTWYGYTAFWGVALAMFAAVATYGSTTKEREPWERLGAVGVVVLMFGYLVGATTLLFLPGAIAVRLAFWIILFMVTMLPGVRAAALLTRTGTRP